MILTEALQDYCKHHKIGARELGKSTGMHWSIAARFLRGETINSVHFADLLIWSLHTLPLGPKKTPKIPPKKFPTETAKDARYHKDTIASTAPPHENTE